MAPRKTGTHLLIVLALGITSCISTKPNQGGDLIIKEQGAFSAGGTVIKSEGVFDALKPWNVPQGGQTRHGDHADVFYQLPANSKKHAMVFLHGYGQSRRSWQTTADGREGFADIFLRKKGMVFILLINQAAAMPGKLQNPYKLRPCPMIRPGLRNFVSVYIPISMRECNSQKIQRPLISFTG